METAMFRAFIADVDDILRRHDVLDETAHTKFIALCRRRLPPGSIPHFIESYIAFTASPDHRPAGSSLAHENGFTKISLAKFRRDEQLRLHIWPETEFVDSRAHSHRWNFSSFILTGGLSGCTYFIDADGDQHFYRLYDAVDSLKTYALEQTGSLVLTGSYDVQAGCGHYLDFRTIHRVRKSAGNGTLSLMLSGPPIAPYSVVSEGSDFAPGRRTFMDTKAIRELLMQTSRRLGALCDHG
jgi:hypothetical protein